MKRKIRVFINGEYQFTTTHFRTIADVIRHIRAVKHLDIASAPNHKYLTVYDYDKIRGVYAD